MTDPIPSTIPIRALEGHGDCVIAVAVFRHKDTLTGSCDERMVTASYDGMLRLWDLKTGVVLKKMEGHSRVRALAASPDGLLIASGDESGELIVWHGQTGECVRVIKAVDEAHSGWIFSLDFSRDSRALASGSSDGTTKLWSTSNWQQHSAGCGGIVHCVRFSPHAKYFQASLAIATDYNIQIYQCDDPNPNSYYHDDYHDDYHSEYNYDYNDIRFPTHFITINGGSNSLAWRQHGRGLLSVCNGIYPTIREWAWVKPYNGYWEQVGDPWKGHFDIIHALSLNSNGTLLASASGDNRVRLWRLSDRRTIAIFKHSGGVNCVTFSGDDGHILSGGVDKKISEWPASEDALLEDSPKDGLMKEQVTHQAQAYYDIKVFAMNSTVRNACIVGDSPTAVKAFNLEICANSNDHIAYANRAFVMARRSSWDRALCDAIKSVRIQPSLAGHISKGISLCGKKQVQAARISFDLASMFTDGDLKTDHFLFLIKAIALFNANEHQEAILRVGELAACPNVDPVACRVVEAYLRVQLGNIALDSMRHNEAVEHFTAAVNASAFFYRSPIHSIYEEFVVLFGWDLKSLWQTANQQQCRALFRAGSFGAAIEAYESIMDNIDEDMKADLRAWFAALK